jgi:hypothetical protein
MGLITDVRLRQPVDNELVGRRFLVTGIGAGFEGTIGIRVLGPKGKVLATDSAQSSGGGIGIGEFSTRVKVDDPPRAGTRLTVQVFGDNPGLPDEGPSPGFNLREVEVIMFPDMQGWLLYRVESGDTLTRSRPHRGGLAAPDPDPRVTRADRRRRAVPSTGDRHPFDHPNHARGAWARGLRCVGWSSSSS